MENFTETSDLNRLSKTLTELYCYGDTFKNGIPKLNDNFVLIN